VGCFILFEAATWGQDYPAEDPNESLVGHLLMLCLTLILVIGEAIILRSYDSPATSERSEPFQSIGEEIFGTVLVVGFWSLYFGFKWQLLPASIYTRHLDSPLFVVFWVAFLIILWTDGFFDSLKFWQR
jgi:hypothetical protein